MQYKGHNFRENNKLVMLPIYDEDNNPMPYVDEDKTNYVYFGKVIARGKKKPLDAIKTIYKWEDTQETVYATPIPLKGHSLTNMAYGEKDQLYLAKGNRCYQAKIQRVNNE